MNKTQLAIVIAYISGILMGPIIAHHTGSTPVPELDLGIQFTIVMTSMSFLFFVFLAESGR